MIDSQEKNYEGEVGKKEIIRLMKGSIVDKWQRMYKTLSIQRNFRKLYPI